MKTELNENAAVKHEAQSLAPTNTQQTLIKSTELKAH